MDLATTPDVYAPSIHKGSYVDFVPPIDKNSGIKCPCNGCTRTYVSKQGFRSHIATQKHIRWIEDVNNNAENYYKELIKSQDTIKTQKLIIARLSQQISELSLCLASQARPAPTESVDLLTFD